MKTIQSWVNQYQTPLYKTIRLLTILVLMTALFFIYTANIKIDEGTPDLYKTLDQLAIFSSLVCLLLLIATVYLGIKRYQTQKALKRHLRKSKLNKQITAFDVFNTSIMTIFMLLCIYPLIYVLAGSFNQGADYAAGGIYFLPRLFTFENYKVVLTNQGLWQGYLVTISRTVIGTATALIFTSIVAYAMSRPNLKFKPIFYWINIFTMFFGGGLIPYFLIIRSVGLYNHFLVYIIPALYSVYNMIIFSSFFRSISDELHEAALMDGANEFRIYWQIYLPLSKPVLATVALWLAIGHWNAYFDTMIYTHSPNLQTLQYFLLKAIQTATLTEGMPAEMMLRLSPKTLSLAAIIISMIPVLFFFPFVRKNFQSGIMIGSLKG
ncbi:carbohydrate ABC transporter permease [Acholeplasma vituli]|uniref:Carbohydrate ABC transporter permease n=1 Tax=Paracholeplasma vituli TaxID=69473 RepID=A0ABT2PZI5_9MOLU|nr:carbohydrate ABC transporter permease [Paracholeplasma vituli]MCU0105127.1 carbohydrate ABC transporter permease [Paracholeplasma vituli]